MTFEEDFPGMASTCRGKPEHDMFVWTQIQQFCLDKQRVREAIEATHGDCEWPSGSQGSPCEYCRFVEKLLANLGLDQ